MLCSPSNLYAFSQMPNGKTLIVTEEEVLSSTIKENGTYKTTFSDPFLSEKVV